MEIFKKNNQIKFFLKFNNKTKISNKTIISKKDFKLKFIKNKDVILKMQKSYPRFKNIELAIPKVNFNNNKNILYKIIYDRKSTRNFKKQKISLNILNKLIYFSIGSKNFFSLKRMYPSAGAIFPIEIYLLSLNTDLKCGLYHYYQRSHSLEELLIFKSRNDINLNKYFFQPFIKKAAILFLLTFFFKKIMIKYGYRGYRYGLIECGHIAQNIQLVSTNLGLKSCCVGGFSDNAINNLIDLDEEEQIIYTIAVGY